MFKVLFVLSLLCTVAYCDANEDINTKRVKSTTTRELANGGNTGESKGSWVLLGSMCFGANTEDEITIKATGNAAGSNQRILFYDDESGSFARAVAATSCAEKVSESKKLSFTGANGKTTEFDGLNLITGEEKVQKIKISEQFKHQWYFVASNCGDTVESEQPVNVQYSISSSKNVDCSILFAKESVAGFVVASVFMIIMVIALAGTSYCFYVKSKPPSMPSVKDNTGYNEL
jgi:hypothetical protein